MMRLECAERLAHRSTSSRSNVNMMASDDIRSSALPPEWTPPTQLPLINTSKYTPLSAPILLAVIKKYQPFMCDIHMPSLPSSKVPNRAMRRPLIAPPPSVGSQIGRMGGGRRSMGRSSACESHLRVSLRPHQVPPSKATTASNSSSSESDAAKASSAVPAWAGPLAFIFAWIAQIKKRFKR